MNLLDLLVVSMLLAAALGGWRLGFFARVASWVGMAAGLLVMARLLPAVLEALQGADPASRMILAVGLLLGAAFAGQALGLVIGAKLHLAIPGPGRSLDRAGGAVAGVVGVLVAVWFLLPAMADVPGTMARQARTSTVAGLIDQLAPPPPDTLQALRRLVGEADFPQVFRGFQAAPDVGPPPEDTGLPPDVIERVTASTMKVEGRACNRIQEGSGFLAGPGVVVTNAHVVAGHERTEIIRPDGQRVQGVVTVFDPDRDLAVVRVPEGLAPPLPLGEGAVGVAGAVFGYPGGGPLRIAPFEIRQEIDAVGRDIYDRSDTRRRVFVLASALRPGDSGAALVNQAGVVVGVAFAIAPDRPGVSYAVTHTELGAVLAGDLNTPADTGPCLR